MFSKANKSHGIDAESREQYEYARSRIIQKKNLMRHFIFFLAGSVLFIILDEGLNMGEQLLGNGWYIWAILIWAFFLMVHSLNVFLMNTFMGKEWENRQLEKLKAKQVERIALLQKQVEQELKLPNNPETIKAPEKPNNPLPNKL